MKEFSKKANLDKLDRELEEFRSKKEKVSPKQIKVQNDGWRMIIELVTGMLLGVSLGLGLDYMIGSEPIFLIIFSLLGFMAGVKTMMTTAKKINETRQIYLYTPRPVCTFAPKDCMSKRWLQLSVLGKRSRLQGSKQYAQIKVVVNFFEIFVLKFHLFRF